MAGKLIATLVLLLAVGSSDAIYRDFICGVRPGQTCGLNGNCDAVSGTCTCNQPYTGFDCRVNTASPGVCNPQCGEKGDCVQQIIGNNLFPSCICEAAYTGADCKDRRFSVQTCTTSSMRISIQTLAGFSGRIYVYGHSTNPLCQLTQGGGIGAPHEATINFATCPQPGNTFVDQVSTETVRCLDVLVLHNPNFIQPYDELHEFCCDGTSPRVVVSLDLKDEQITLDNLHGIQVTSGNTNINARFSLAPNRAEIPTFLSIGDNLFVEFDLAPNTPAGTLFKVQQCFAYAPDDGTNAQEILVSGGCASVGSHGIVPLFKLEDTVILQFQLFRFVNSVKLRVSCDVTYCTSTVNVGQCSPSNCADGGFTAGLGRRRRQTDKSEKTTTLIGELYVLATPEELDLLLQTSQRSQTQELKTKEDTCLNSTAFIAVVTVCAILLIVALVALGLIYFRLRNDRRVESINYQTKG